MPGEADRIGELLVEEGVVTQEELARALAAGGLKGTDLAQALDGSPHVRRAELAAYLGNQFRIPTLSDLRQIAFADGIGRLVPEDLARKHELIPIVKMGDILCVAKPNYFNRAAVQELRKLTGLKVKVLQADEAQVRSAIDKLYRGSAGDLPAPGGARAAAAAPAAPAPAPVEESSSFEAVPLISSGEGGPPPPGGQNVDEVIEIMEAVRIPSQEFAAALRAPFNRMIVDFDDVFRVGKAASPGPSF